MLTTKRRAVARAHYKNPKLMTTTAAARELGLTRERFRQIRHLFAYEELTRLWNSKN